jgi:plasmid stabilization system protein ParE
MSYKVEITEKAQEETRNAIRWIAQYSMEKAALWHFELMEKVESLENFPTRCPLAPESEIHGKEIRHLIFDKYRILFIICLRHYCATLASACCHLQRCSFTWLHERISLHQ